MRRGSKTCLLLVAERAEETRPSSPATMSSGDSNTVTNDKAQTKVVGNPVKAKQDKLERRRTSNRLSARRWRNKKKCKFAELERQINELRKDHAQLESENTKLKTELAKEIELAKEESSVTTAQCGRQWLPQLDQRPLFFDAEPGDMGRKPYFKASSSTIGSLPPYSLLSELSRPYHAVNSRKGNMNHAAVQGCILTQRMFPHPFPSHSSSFAYATGVSRAELSSILHSATSSLSMF